MVSHKPIAHPVFVEAKRDVLLVKRSADPKRTYARDSLIFKGRVIYLQLCKLSLDLRLLT